jgi:23S rRNA pseudouridine1911/1915/1917 synthase
MKHLVVDSAPTVTLLRQLVDSLGELLEREVTEAEVRRIAEQGAVYVNKVRFHDAEVCPPPGTLEVFYPELPIVVFRLAPCAVIYEDEHLLAIDKPFGVNTAPSPFSDRDCLTWGVQNYLNSGFEVHAVHRLDRDTSGLVLFAKHKLAEKGLHALFRERRIRKVYRGVTPQFEVCRHLYRIRDELDWRGKVQTAATTILFEGALPPVGPVPSCWSWLVLPHTGRPHQIRKHFVRYLVALLNDPVYSRLPVTGPLGLRCIGLKFRHPVTGVRLEVTL